MTNESIGITIGVALKGIAELSKLKGSFVDIKQTIKDTTGSINGFKNQLASIRLSEHKRLKLGIDKENLKTEFLSATSLIARGTAIGMPVKLAIDFESAMADVKKVVNFSSDGELKEFENKIKALSREIPLSLKELASITAAGGQMGIPKEQLMDFTKIASKMSVAFDMSADMAGESMGKLMNIFNMDLKAIETLGDKINYLSDNSASKANQIVEVLKRIGGTAKTIKMSENAVTALASSFISLGKTPELAATSADTLMKRLGNAKSIAGKSEGFRNALNTLGFDENQLASMMNKDADKTILMVLERIKGLDEHKRLPVLTELFGDGFSGDIALLVNGLDTYKKALKDVASEEAKGAMGKEAANRAKTTANALQLLRNSFEEIAVNFGSVFLPAISGIARGIASFVTKITDLSNKIPGLNSILGFSVLGFLALKPAILGAKLATNYFKDTKELLNIALQKAIIKTKIYIGILRQTTIHHKIGAFFTNAYKFALNSLKFVIGGVGKAFRLLVIGIKAVSVAMMNNPLGLILGGIAIAAGLVIANWDKVKAWFTSFVEWIKPYFAPIGQFLSDAFNSFFTWISSAFSWLNSVVISVGEFFKSIFGGVVDFLSSAFGSFFDWIGNKFAWVGDITSKIGSVFSGVKSFLGFGNDENDNTSNKLGISKDEFTSLSNTLTIKPSTAQVGEYPLITSAYALGNMQTITNNHSASQNLQAVNISFGNINASNFDKADFERYIKSYFRKEEQNARNRDVRD